MAENVSFHGDLAQLSGPARCNGCQAGGHRCVFAKDDTLKCISCSTVGRDCILTRPLTISAPSTFFTWETLLYREPMTNIQVPSDTTTEQFRDALAPFNPDGPKNAIVRRYSHREPPKETVREPPLPAPVPPPAPAKVEPPPTPTSNDDTIRLQNGAPPSSSARSSSPFPSATYSFTKDPLESLPGEVTARRPGLRSAQQQERIPLQLDTSTIPKADFCDDCAKHRRKTCPPSHRRTTARNSSPRNVTPRNAAAAAKPSPVVVTPVTPAPPPAPAQRSPSTQRFPCSYAECEKDFTFMGDLQRHTREIHGVDLDGNPVEPHHCPIDDCTRHIRPFARRDNLRQHLEKRHGMTPDEADNLLVKRPRTGRRSNAS